MHWIWTFFPSLCSWETLHVFFCLVMSSCLSIFLYGYLSIDIVVNNFCPVLSNFYSKLKNLTDLHKNVNYLFSLIICALQSIILRHSVFRKKRQNVFFKFMLMGNPCGDQRRCRHLNICVETTRTDGRQHRINKWEISKQRSSLIIWLFYHSTFQTKFLSLLWL